MSDSLQPHGLYPPGSPIHGILQARILEWVAIPFSNALLPAHELTGKRRNELPFPCNLQGSILPCEVAF